MLSKISIFFFKQLSLRDNPLVVRFVSDMMHTVPSLLELAARTVKLRGIRYSPTEVPRRLADYLGSAHHCINPKCKGLCQILLLNIPLSKFSGVFFDNRVEHVKFVDFCGKYRVPLLQYLCSSNCIDDKADVDIEPEMLRKVLLG